MSFSVVFLPVASQGSMPAVVPRSLFVAAEMPVTEPATDPAHDDQLDARGLRCPEPLLLVRNRLRSMTKGQVLHILSTDPSTTRDFHNLCRFMGHELMAERLGTEPLEYWIRKG